MHLCSNSILGRTATIVLVVICAFLAADLSWWSKAASAEKNDKKKAGAPKGKKAALPPGWFSDYDQALAQAKKTGQPLLVLFH